MDDAGSSNRADGFGGSKNPTRFARKSATQQCDDDL
jgi:hypothetical protein